MKTLGLNFASAILIALSITSCSSDDAISTNTTSTSSSSTSSNSTKDISTKSSYISGKLSLLNTNNLSTLGLPHGSYSGITMVSDGKYAIVDDHALEGGIFTIEFDLAANGKIRNSTLTRTQLEGTTFCANDNYGGDKNWKDPEGIIYHKSTDTYFVACERYQEIREYDRNGKETGRKLNIPDEFSYYVIQEGFGFESLAYNENTGLFWTTTEKALIADQKEGNNQHTLRFQSFGEDLNPGKQIIYNTDVFNENAYTHGVSDIVALDDGRLIVVEREVEVYNEQLASLGIKYISPFKYNTKTKLYLVDPSKVSDGGTVDKVKLEEFDTAVDDVKTPSLADYEGICLGPKINGKQTILLLSDTQNGMGGSMGSISVTMQEYLKVYTIE